MSTQGIPFSRTALPGAQPADAPGSVRINAIWELPRLLEELGVDLQGALDAVGLEPAIFSDRENRVDYPVFGELLLECERRTGRDDFGLLIGQRTRLADFGLAGQVARCSDSAGAGLDNFISLFNLHNTAALVTEIATGDFARLVFAICEPRMSDTRHLQQGSMAIGFNILKDLCGPDWRPTEVNFACRSPASLRSFQKFFQAPLRFDSDESSVVFERSWLDAPLPPVDPAERLAIERAARVARAAVLADFPAFVRRLMRKQLLLGRYSMDEIAALLSIHRRTLHRRLAEHDAAYGDMLESVKYEVARQLLVDTDMPVQAIAESLRFSTAANFATAFKNWSGVTPTEFRSGSRG